MTPHDPSKLTMLLQCPSIFSLDSLGWGGSEWSEWMWRFLVIWGHFLAPGAQHYRISSSYSFCCNEPYKLGPGSIDSAIKWLRTSFRNSQKKTKKKRGFNAKLLFKSSLGYLPISQCLRNKQNVHSHKTPEWVTFPLIYIEWFWLSTLFAGWRIWPRLPPTRSPRLPPVRNTSGKAERLLYSRNAVTHGSSAIGAPYDCM